MANPLIGWSDQGEVFVSEGIAYKAEPTADGGLEVSGYAAIFHAVDKQNEVLEPTDDLQAILDEAVKAGTPILYEHREGTILGRVIEAKAKRAGIWIRAKLNPQPVGSKLREVFEAVKAGAIKGLSFRGPILKALGAEGPARIRLRRLQEVSVARRPVQALAQLEAVAAKAEAESPRPPTWTGAELVPVRETVGYLG